MFYSDEFSFGILSANEYLNIETMNIISCNIDHGYKSLFEMAWRDYHANISNFT